MPAYHLKCDKCQKSLRKLLPKFEAMTCECGGQFERIDPTKVTAQIKEVLDNGVMVRKVERLHNIDQLVKERSQEPEGDDFV